MTLEEHYAAEVERAGARARLRAARTVWIACTAQRSVDRTRGRPTQRIETGEIEARARDLLDEELAARLEAARLRSSLAGQPVCAQSEHDLRAGDVRGGGLWDPQRAIGRSWATG
jgi:hypothetical protein